MFHTPSVRRTLAAIVAGLVWLVGSLSSPAASFNFGNPLAVARTHHTATLLTDGRLLVAGGDGANYVNELASTEVYDPKTGAWTTVGPLNAARANHTASLLPGGQVLVVGGHQGGGGGPTLNSAELFSPAMGAWSMAQSMHTPREGHTATVLPDGHVVVIGGTDVEGISPVSTAEIFDPIAGTWQMTSGNLGHARTGHTATLLPNGEILIVGGSNGTTPLQSAELYDPQAGQFQPAGMLTTARQAHTATLLNSGLILVVGGDVSAGTTTATAELYNPANLSFAPTPSLANTRGRHIAIRLPNGTVLVAGGENGTDSIYPAEIYDPVANAWLGSYPTGPGAYGHLQSGGTATLMTDGSIFVVGGAGQTTVFNTLVDYNQTNVVEIYQGGIPESLATSSLNAARSSQTATLLPNGKVLLVGGSIATNQPALSSAEIFDPAALSWTATQSLPAGVTMHGAVLLANGKVLIAGGSTGGSSAAAVSSAALYDFSTGSWAVTGSLTQARFNLATTVMADGRVIAAGGENVTRFGQPLPTYSQVELYDPFSGLWQGLAPMLTNRTRHTATLLPDGRILVVGGLNGSGALASAEVYDPSTGQWTLTGSLSHGRSQHTATLLPNGKVLVCGGVAPVGGPSPELYDPATGLWTTMWGELPLGTSTATATLLPDGRLMLAGGYANGAVTYISLYDPNLGSWYGGSLLTQARYSHTATLLPDGRVLLAGGTGSAALRSAELFDTGLKAPRALQPQIFSVNDGAPLLHGASLVLTGNLFGPAGSGSGATQDSSSLYPVVQVRSLVNGQTITVSPASASAITATGFQGAPFTGLVPGYAFVTLFSQGTPGVSTIIELHAEVPEVVTSGAQNVGLNRATVAATVNPNGAATYFAFEYTTDRNFASGVDRTPYQTLPADAGLSPVTDSSLIALAPHTTYYFRVIAMNPEGETAGTVSSFRTLFSSPSAPDLSVTAATGLTQTLTLDFPAQDPDGDPVNLSAVTGDANLTVKSFTGHKVTIQVAQKFTGAGHLSYTASTDFASASGTVTVSVPDDAPTITFIDGGGPLNFAYGSQTNLVPAPTIHDAVDGNSLTYTVTGTIDTSTPGTYTLTYTATDSGGNTTTVQRQVVVEPPPSPVAASDHYFFGGTSRAPITLPVLLNDTAYVTSSLTISGVAHPYFGTAKVSTDGKSLVYTPSVAFSSLPSADTFSYTIRDGLGLTATGTVTIENSVLRVKGVYDALLTSTDGETEAYLKLTLSASGAFTGTFRLGTASQAVRGQFDVQQAATITLPSHATISLQFDSTGEGIINAGYTLALTGLSGNLTRTPFDASHLASQTGRYTVALNQPTAAQNNGIVDASQPAGPGYAILTVAKTGTITLAGTFGEGTALTASGFLKEDGSMALFQTVAYRPGPAGTLTGLIHFGDQPATSDCDGTLRWLKPLQKSASLYRNGFDVALILEGSRYLVPTSHEQALGFTNSIFGTATVSLINGDLPADQSATVSVSNTNVIKVTSTNTEHLALKFAPSTGLFSGSFEATFPPATKPVTKAFTGVLLQRQNIARGLFLGPTHSGEVLLTPQ